MWCDGSALIMTMIKVLKKNNRKDAIGMIVEKNYYNYKKLVRTTSRDSMNIFKRIMQPILHPYIIFL